MALIKKWFGETTKYQKKVKALVEELSPDQELYAHSGRVACKFLSNNELYTLAWVHDLVEDGFGTLDKISRRFSLSEDQKNALDALTRRKGEGYFRYIHRVKQNYRAVAVKLMDLEDNIFRCSLDVASKWSLLERYAKAYGTLIGEKKDEVL